MMGRHPKTERNGEILRLYIQGVRVNRIADRMAMTACAVSAVIKRAKQAGLLSQDGRQRLSLDRGPDECRHCGEECHGSDCRGCRRMWREIHSVAPARIYVHQVYVGTLARPEETRV